MMILYQLLLHCWGLFWLYVSSSGDLGWLLLECIRVISYGTLCNVRFFDRLNYLFISIDIIVIIHGNNELGWLLSWPPSSCIINRSLIKSSNVLGIRWFWVLLVLLKHGILLLLWLKLLTCCGLGGDRLTSVISMLLQSCTIFTSGLSGGCLKITVPGFTCSFGHRLLHLHLDLMMVLWYSKLLWDPSRSLLWRLHDHCAIRPDLLSLSLLLMLLLLLAWWHVCKKWLQELLIWILL